MSHRSAVIDPVVIGRSRDLLDRAYLLFDNADAIEFDALDAGLAVDEAERFRQYYLSALRAAGAAIALHEPRLRPVRVRGSRSAWSRLRSLIPSLSPFAESFAARSRTRMNIESGIDRTVDPEVVGALRADAVRFLGEVEGLIIAYEQGKSAGSRSGSADTA